MLRDTFATGFGVCLPNAPVDNSGIEDVLGHLPSQSTAAKERILKINGIATRYYAIDPATGAMTHSNASMTAEAVDNLCRNSGFAKTAMECLVCSTSVPDQILPSHGSMVHGELGCPPCEVATISGVCASGVNALKFAYMNVAAGLRDNAVATASELISPNLRAAHFESQCRADDAGLETMPYRAFATEFLRWMLSDGAGAILVSPAPNKDAPSLRIDWIDSLSFASESEVCMYMGLRKRADGTHELYRTPDTEEGPVLRGLLNLSQDVKILNSAMPGFMKAAGKRMIERYNVLPDEVDWLLPHYSSHWFRQMAYDGLVEAGFKIPYDRWFTNLGSKGNIGSASIYVMLEELVASGRLKTGQRIVCLVPESARMTFGFMHFTVV